MGLLVAMTFVTMVAILDCGVAGVPRHRLSEWL
jgi:hypothetical protein